MNRLKTLLNRKNAVNIILIVFAAVIIISPKAKALVIKAMLKTGLMPPPTESLAADKSLSTLPEIVLKSSDGKILETGRQKGKVLIINFWATWCPPCIAEMGTINEMYLHYKTNPKVLIIPVDVDSDFKKSLVFMKDHQYSLPVYQLTSNLPPGFISDAIPNTLIVNKNGVITAKHEGAANYSDKAFYTYIDKLIAE